MFVQASWKYCKALHRRFLLTWLRQVLNHYPHHPFLNQAWETRTYGDWSPNNAYSKLSSYAKSPGGDYLLQKLLPRDNQRHPDSDDWLSPHEWIQTPSLDNLANDLGSWLARYHPVQNQHRERKRARLRQQQRIRYQSFNWLHQRAVPQLEQGLDRSLCVESLQPLPELALIQGNP